MSRINLEGYRAADLLIERGQRVHVQEWVPANNAVIDPNMPPYLIMAPAGAVNILMPAATQATKGLWFLMTNNSANVITLQTSAGAGFTTAITLAAQQTRLVICTGNATAALGWRAI